jgi:hypothetical protein
MFSKTQCTRTRSDITAFSILENDTFVFSTKYNGAKIFSSLDCSSLNNLSIKLLNPSTTAIAFHETKNILAFANSNIIYIIDTDTKNLLQTIKTNEGEITLMFFVKNSKYLITGTKNGRVMQYRYDGRFAISRLCSFGHKVKSKGRVQENYVSAFTQMDDKIACSGYGGIITILTLNSYQLRHHIETSKGRITALLFLDKHQLISANIDGVLQRHSLKKYQQTKTLITPLHNIKNITLLSNSDFILAHGDSNNIILVDIKNMKVVDHHYISFKESISQMQLFKGSLFVVTASRNIQKVKLPAAEDLKSALSEQRLDKVYKIIDRDPTLKGTREHKRAEVMYERLFSKAIEALSQNSSDEREAHQILKMFNNIESKKSEINAMFQAFKHYSRFKNYYLEKKYHIAYVIAERHPALKRTFQFKKMEDIFKEAFSFAQKQILLGREDVAKEILTPYATVLSKKPILELLLSNNKEFLEFLKAIEQKKHMTVEILLKENTIFQEIPTYVALKKSLENVVAEIDNSIDSLELEKAQELLEAHRNIQTLKGEISRLEEKLHAVKLLQEAYAKNDFITCYEIIDTYSDIKELELSQLLEKHWSKLLTQCEEFAMKGDFKSIKKTLGELIQVNTRAQKIGDLLRLSFFTQIKVLLAKSNFKKAEAIIYSYNDIFGIDREMRAIMKTYENVAAKKLAITQPKEKSIPRDAWREQSKIMD